MKFEWKECSLGDIITLVIDHRGLTPKKLGGDWSNCGYRALSAKNVKMGKLVNEESIRFVGAEMYYKWMPEEVKYGDILITSEAPFGEIIQWNSHEKIVLSQRLFGLRISSKCDANFMYYYMTTGDFQGEMRSRATGTTVIGLRQPELLKCKVRFPDLRSQKRIAEVLASLDDKIETNTAINKNLEEQAQAIYKSWFVDFAPFGGKIPENWKKYKLSEFVPVITGKKNANVSSDKGMYPFFSCSQNIAWTNDFSFEGDAILVAGNGDFNVKFYNGKFEAYQRTYVLIPYNSLYTAWLYYAIKQSLREITLGARGSVIRFITKGNLENFTIVAPVDINNMCLIHKFHDINTEIALRRKEILCLQKLRDTLLPRLMSGEIDVSNIEI